MKSSETLKPCPICGKMVRSERPMEHIAQMARRERESNLQKPKPHNNFIISGVKPKTTPNSNESSKTTNTPHNDQNEPTEAISGTTGDSTDEPINPEDIPF